MSIATAPPGGLADATLLINNAATAAFAGPLDEASRDAARREMAVNYGRLR